MLATPFAIFIRIEGIHYIFTTFADAPHNWPPASRETSVTPSRTINSAAIVCPGQDEGVKGLK